MQKKNKQGVGQNKNFGKLPNLYNRKCVLSTAPFSWASHSA